MYQFYRYFQQKVLRKAYRIICTSPNYLESSEQLKNFRDKVQVIPLGINIKRLETNTEYERFDDILKKHKSKFIILSIGRLVSHKGFDYLIEASKYLDDNFIIIIVGGGPLFEKLKEKVIKFALKDRVILLGRVDNINPLLKKV